MNDDRVTVRGTSWRAWLRAVDVLKWSALFGLFLIVTPCLAWTSQLFAGMFGDLGAPGVYFSVLAACGAAWSLMFSAGMQVESAAVRFLRPLRRLGNGKPDRLLPRCIEDRLCVPLTATQAVLAHVLAAPAAVAMIVLSSAPLRGAVASILAAVTAYALALFMALPVFATAPRPQATSRWRAWVFRVAHVPVVKRLSTVWRRAVSWALRRARLRFLLESDAPDAQVEADHFLAICGALSTAGLLAVLAIAFHPPYTGAFVLPTPFLLFSLLTMLIWLVGAVEYHLARFGIPPVLLFLGFAAVAYLLGQGVDQRFTVHLRPAAADASAGQSPLDPVSVVRASPRPRNVVVVCATGGGILAAGWTALALDRLTARGAVEPAEIRLLSTVSGGSVGAACYVQALLARASPHKAIDAAVAPSLPAVVHGLVFADFVRTLTAGLSARLLPNGRGQYLEQQWQETARALLGAPADAPTLLDLVPEIERGAIPAVIFNATAMESGRRVMLTPLAWPRSEAGTLRRGDTLSEYVLGERAGSLMADLGLWTAARVSATFPYVTPAASPAAGGEGLLAGPGEHHFIDGGYYDNYGVASALDWLEAVLAARAVGVEGLSFERVAILQVRAFPLHRPADVAPSHGFVTELLGPAIGITRIRDGAAFSRNEIALARFLERWNERLDGRVELRTFVFEPEEGERGPLSWAMTRGQVEQMKARWDASRPILAEVEAVRAFLRR